jgi:hypothetical protein
LDENRERPVAILAERAESCGSDPCTDPKVPLQFGIAALLVVQAAFAGLLSLLMIAGVWAIIPAFLLTVAIQWWPFRIRNVALRRVTFDLLAGVVLPVLCIWYDPIVFVERGAGSLASFRTPIYLLIVIEIIALLGWLVFDTLTRRPSGLFAGMLAPGCAAAAAIGVMILPV